METVPSHLVKFDGKLLFLGFGAVARCTFPMLFNHIEIPLSRITILDVFDKSKELESYISKGLRFQVIQMSQDNCESILSQYLSRGDILIELAVNIDTKTLFEWCQVNGVMYINAAVEEWGTQGHKEVIDETLFARHTRIKEAIARSPKMKSDKGPTAVLEHGANPGLISHFVKQSLVDIANQAIQDKKFSEAECEELQKLLRCTHSESKQRRKECFAMLAMKLGVKVIHCSERDTQVTNKPKRVNEFVNTWSVEGFYEEGVAPAELGWGTHERWAPTNAAFPKGKTNPLFLNQCGINTLVKSFVPPNHHIIGMAIRHGEAFSISEYLTVFYDDKKKVRYRPTVHYAYLPCDSTIASIHELRGLHNRLQPQRRIIRDADIVDGGDYLGALVMGHHYNSWWTGSCLNIHQARKLIHGQNCTTLQVAAGLTAAIIWMIKNPNEGLCLPDDLPYDFILQIAKPYLGTFISQPYDWTPLSHCPNSHDDPWQFKSFLYHMNSKL